MTCPIASYMDVALLNPELTRSEVEAILDQLIPLKPCTFCIRPSDIPLVKPICREHRIGLCVVLGFPHGHQLPECKADEAQRYLSQGVDEIDMVCNIGAVRSGDWDRVKEDIRAVSALTRPAGVALKVIFETCFLTEAEIRKLVEVCIVAQADFVKTSTGFNGEGAQDHHVKLMLETAAHRIQVKPSGGIATKERAENLIGLGATRLGVGYKSALAICGEGDASADAGAY
jgi:deoxyribose-phosphate aldolase